MKRKINNKSIRRKSSTTSNNSRYNSTRKDKNPINKLKLFIVIIIFWAILISIVGGILLIYKTFTKNSLNNLHKPKEVNLSVDASKKENKIKKDGVIESKEDEVKEKEVKEDLSEEMTDVLDEEIEDISFKEKVINIFKEEKEVIELPYASEEREPQTVFIDASFGGTENGAVSKSGVKAKDITLAIAKKVEYNLSKYKDINVVMSRTDDAQLSQSERIELINKSNADLMVCVRVNGQSSGFTATGIETYYNSQNDYSDKSYKLAESVKEVALTYVDAKERYILDTNIDLLKKTNMPSIIIQTGFLTTLSEEKKLTDEKYQDYLAQGIAQGILQYIDNNR